MSIKNLFIIFGFYLIININSQSCSPNTQINQTSCFNALKIFDLENKYYRAGHFASNKKGDMIIEYSYQQFRLFYGLKKDGKLFYPNETKEIEIINNETETEMLTRYESINLFVSLTNDINKEKEYLMSLSSWKTLAELHDLETDEYNIITSINFFNSEEGTYSFVFQLLEATFQNKKIYFCIHTIAQDNRRIIVIQIKRFGLSNLTFGLELEKTIPVGYNKLIRITSSIIYENFQLIAIFYWPYDQNYYKVGLYNYELELKNETQITDEFSNSISTVDGMFFKVCNLYDQYAAFFYFLNEHRFSFEILALNL